MKKTQSSLQAVLLTYVSRVSPGRALLGAFLSHRHLITVEKGLRGAWKELGRGLEELRGSGLVLFKLFTLSPLPAKRVIDPINLNLINFANVLSGFHFLIIFLLQIGRKTFLEIRYQCLKVFSF